MEYLIVLSNYLPLFYLRNELRNKNCTDKVRLCNESRNGKIELKRSNKSKFTFQELNISHVRTYVTITIEKMTENAVD